MCGAKGSVRLGPIADVSVPAPDLWNGLRTELASEGFDLFFVDQLRAGSERLADMQIV